EFRASPFLKSRGLAFQQVDRALTAMPPHPQESPEVLVIQTHFTTYHHVAAEYASQPRWAEFFLRNQPGATNPRGTNIIMLGRARRAI
ncbi:hypothetical protein EVAR_71298_1, partial [Eumeta japonica]